MELTEFSRAALELLAPLGPILHAAMEPSIEEARDYLASRRWDGYVFADLVRYHTCCRLKEMSLPSETAFSRLPNNGILLTRNRTSVRVWKSDEGGKLQGPGASRSKQAYFDQERLFSTDPADFRYAVVWEHDLETGLLTLSLACPKGFDASRPWNNPECHFYIEFPHAATIVPAAPTFVEPEPIDDLVIQPKKHVSESDDD